MVDKGTHHIVRTICHVILVATSKDRQGPEKIIGRLPGHPLFWSEHPVRPPCSRAILQRLSRSRRSRRTDHCHHPEGRRDRRTPESQRGDINVQGGRRARPYVDGIVCAQWKPPSPAWDEDRRNLPTRSAVQQRTVTHLRQAPNQRHSVLPDSRHDWV